MKWVSTRRASPPVSFVDALFAGTAPDGGLYFPERFDVLPSSSLDAIRAADLVETTEESHLQPVTTGRQSRPQEGAKARIRSGRKE